jgi:hypothetical protein
MSNARNLARLIVDSGGDVDVSSLGNVPPSNDASALTTGTLGTARLPAGSVLQVQQTVKTSTADSAAGAWASVMTVTITPSYTNSKIFLLCNPGSLYPGIGGYAGDYYVCRISKNNQGFAAHNSYFHAEMGRGEGIGVRQYPVLTALDAPATTSAVTYSLDLMRTSGSGALRINDTSGTSVFTAFEIAG